MCNSCTQFPLETVIQLLIEAGVDLASDASANASGKPSEAAAPDADNLDLVNMPATFDYEGHKTSWGQGLPPGEVGAQLSEFELSDSDSDSSVGSILDACLDGFNGDVWMLDAEEAQDDIKVGAAAGVNDPSDIPWRMTTCSAGGVDVGSVKAAKRAGEGVSTGGGSMDSKDTVRQRGQANGNSENAGWAVLSAEEREKGKEECAKMHSCQKKDTNSGPGRVFSGFEKTVEKKSAHDSAYLIVERTKMST